MTDNRNQQSGEGKETDNTKVNAGLGSQAPSGNEEGVNGRLNDGTNDFANGDQEPKSEGSTGEAGSGNS